MKVCGKDIAISGHYRIAACRLKSAVPGRSGRTPCRRCENRSADDLFTFMERLPYIAEP